MTTVGPVTVETATQAALAAAEFAGVTVKTLAGPSQMALAAALTAHVWRSTDSSPADASLLQVLSHTGNFVAGAFSGEELVVFSFGFFTAGQPPKLHSHITCTADEYRNAGLGYALKLYQRAWALGNGIESITWTCDPLVRGNAVFNLLKLQAEVEEYLPNFYGSMSDGVNSGDESDRLLMSWSLSRPLAAANQQLPGRVPDFQPVSDNVVLQSAAGEVPRRLRPTADLIGAQVPTDIVSLRAADPGLALRWRHELRTVLLEAFALGYRIVGFTRTGYYLLRRDAA